MPVPTSKQDTPDTRCVLIAADLLARRVKEFLGTVSFGNSFEPGSNLRNALDTYSEVRTTAAVKAASEVPE
jgi:hypothetical protein